MLPNFHRRSHRSGSLCLSVGLVLLGLAHNKPALASQPLETESCRLLPAGAFEVQTGFEYQTSSEGTESALPIAFEYGLTNRWELLVEPVPQTTIRPKSGRKASGVGDLEVTLTYLLRPEGTRAPAFAFAGEVKVPTAKDRLIGTGKTDLSALLIASKRFGRLDTHANLGYTVLGKPPGVEVKNIVNFALAGEFHWTPKFDLVAEVLTDTRSSSDGADSPTPGAGGENPLSAELAGGETVGLLGLRYQVNPKLTFALGVTYDNNGALLVRPGLTFRFK